MPYLHQTDPPLRRRVTDQIDKAMDEGNEELEASLREFLKTADELQSEELLESPCPYCSSNMSHVLSECLCEVICDSEFCTCRNSEPDFEDATPSPCSCCRARQPHTFSFCACPRFLPCAWAHCPERPLHS